MMPGTGCWPAVAMQSAFWGPLAPAASQTDLWCELSCLFWFCHTLLIIYCWEKFCRICWAFRSSDEKRNGNAKYFQENKSLGRKSSTPKHGCLIQITGLLIFPFLRPAPDICFSFWPYSKHFWSVVTPRLLWAWPSSYGCGCSWSP